MSRYSLSDVFVFPTNEPGLTDLNGWSLDDWDNHAVMGWDSNLSTYFLQVDMPQLDTPVWWLGKTPGVLTSPYEIQAIVRALFGVSSFGYFAFRPGMLEQMLDERDRDFDLKGIALEAHAEAAALVRSFRQLDEQFELSEMEMVPTEEWMRQTVQAGVKKDTAGMTAH